jgi:preprotein translocase subunit SecF
MDILKNSRTYVALSSVLVLISIFFLFFGKLNLGIDMTGGISMEYSYEKEVNITEVQEELSKVAAEINTEKQIINDTSVYGITGEKALSVVVGFYNNTTSGMSEVEKREANVVLESHKENIRAKTLEILEKQDSSIIESKYINIGKSF